MKLYIYLFAIALLFSQNPKERYTESAKLLKKVFSDYSESNFSGAVSNLNEYLNLQENHSLAHYYLTLNYAKLNDEKNTLKYLALLADKKRNVPFSTQKAFQFISPEKKEVMKKRFSENKTPLNNSSEVFKMHQKGLISESIAYNSDTEDYFISSVRKAKIFKRNKQGVFSDFLTFRHSIFSIKRSSDKQFLWATFSSADQQEIVPKVKKSGMLKIDIHSGKIVNTYEVNTDKEHILGDFIFDKNENIYITDSKESAIFFLEKGSNKITPFFKEGYFSSLQGLVLIEKNLIVADYSEGLFSVNLTSKKVTRIVIPKNLDARGIDGLYQYKKSLIVTQNGFNPNRVIRLYMDKQTVSSYNVLEANHLLIDDPTLGIIVNDDFLFIANSGWNDVGKSNQLKPNLRETSILKVSLK
jgi:hypothetical protein